MGSQHTPLTDQGRRQLGTAARYVEINPVSAGSVHGLQDSARSSTVAYTQKQDDRLVRVAPLLALAGPWRRFLVQGVDAETVERLSKHERTGRS